MGNIIRPIKPSEILDRKAETIPDEMIQAVNELIAKNWNGISATFRQDDLLARYFELAKKENDRANQEYLFDNHMLDFEDLYKKEGWSVNYDKPGYNESYEPTFKFKRKNYKEE